MNQPPADSAHWSFSSRHFPNISARAYYSPRTLAVYLPQDAAPGASEDEQKAWLTERLPILVHEFQHGLDHVGTVAGRELLDALIGALFALECKLQMNGAELHRFVSLHKAERRFDRRAYFTEFDPTYQWLGAERPRWKWGTSTGVGFTPDGHPNEEDPLFFLRFNDIDQNILVGRQPITPAALFETRAVYAELEHAVAIKTIEATRDPSVLDAFHLEQQRLLYDPHLLLYSAPAHFAASRCTTGDVLESYTIAAHAAGIALNIAPGLEFEPRIHEAYRQPGSMDRLERLIAARDPGFLYLQIIAHAPRYEGDVNAWLDAALEAAGFPPRDAIFDAAQAHLSIPSFALGSSFDPVYFRATTEGGVNFARLRRSCGLLDQPATAGLGTVKGPASLPQVLLRHGTMYLPVDGIVEAERQLMMLETESILSRHMDEFLAAVR